jgi:hypothetical protein
MVCMLSFHQNVYLRNPEVCCVELDLEHGESLARPLSMPTTDAFPNVHYVKTSNRSRNICNEPLTPVTCTHICNYCCLAPVTHKRGRPTPGFATTTPVTNKNFW